MEESSEEVDSDQEQGMAERWWQRNDNYAINERDCQGFFNKPGPVLNVQNAVDMPFFKFAISWFDTEISD
eukprot:6185252-Pleurochrysis_carterae.AAC.1